LGSVGRTHHHGKPLLPPWRIQLAFYRTDIFPRALRSNGAALRTAASATIASIPAREIFADRASENRYTKCPPPQEMGSLKDRMAFLISKIADVRQQLGISRGDMLEVKVGRRQAHLYPESAH
jgi:hypothetical protein